MDGAEEMLAVKIIILVKMKKKHDPSRPAKKKTLIIKHWTYYQ